MSIVKIYRFKIQQEAWDDFMSLQKKANQLYSKHVDFSVEYVRDFDDPSFVTEIHRYANDIDAKLAESIVEKEPALNTLFQEFLIMLDPEDDEIEEISGSSYQV